jgi:hypothetical protein
MNWYEENIEEPIRDVVKHLRDNGFNTECSCGHEMYIQIGHSLDGELMRLHSLLFCYFAEKKEKVSYEIIMRHKVMDQCPFTSVEIRLTGRHKHINTLRSRLQYYKKRIEYIEKDLENEEKTEKNQDDNKRARERPV